MKALSVRAPFWWFILHAGKDIENRDWPTTFRGTVYLHASKWFSKPAVIEDAHSAVECFNKTLHICSGEEITWDEMRAAGGCVVGKVDIVDCVTASASPWFFGRYGFVLANPVAFAQPIPCKGALGFFTVPDEVLAQLRQAVPA
jgi:hypothetical protein